VAGCSRLPFSRLALRRLHDHAGGVPRLLNVIADRALIAGYARNLAQIGERDVDQAAAESLASPPRRIQLQRVRVPVVAAALVLLLTVTVAFWPQGDDSQITDEPATPEPVPVEPPPTPLAALLPEAGVSPMMAWTGLLALWTVRAEEVDAASAARCPPQPAPGLYCLRGAGNLAKLETLRRPVILRLSSEQHQAFAVLLGLSRTRARLSLAGETVDVSRRDLERSWLGEFFALYRAPTFLPNTLRRGDSGPAVDWLHHRLLSRELLQRSAPQPGFYDAATEAAVRSLQAAHGLVPDGIVGQETLLALAADEDGGPRLRTRLN
jgi:general secretion pathway protein A